MRKVLLASIMSLAVLQIGAKPTPPSIKVAPTAVPTTTPVKKGYFKVIVLYSDDMKSWKEFGANTFYGSQLDLNVTVDGKTPNKAEDN